MGPQYVLFYVSCPVLQIDISTLFVTRLILRNGSCVEVITGLLLALETKYSIQ